MLSSSTLYQLCTNSSQSIGIVSLANWLKPAAINGPLYTKADHDGKSEKGDLDHPCHCQVWFESGPANMGYMFGKYLPEAFNLTRLVKNLDLRWEKPNKGNHYLVDIFSLHFQILQFLIF